MRLGFSSAFAASDGTDPVPLRAPTKADSSATAGADSTPDACIPCLGALGPTDESVVNVTEYRRRWNERRKPVERLQEKARKTRRGEDSENYLRTQNAELNGAKVST